MPGRTITIDKKIKYSYGICSQFGPLTIHEISPLFWDLMEDCLLLSFKCVSLNVVQLYTAIDELVLFYPDLFKDTLVLIQMIQVISCTEGDKTHGLHPGLQIRSVFSFLKCLFLHQILCLTTC